ncbi:hypothetical protein Hypma_003180 [Hypsizygus marmoreus]|uniref:Uncharacterized protein n=1 Tax=Hypsizygus marmoreus TaxID=39966 RepID=A0A369K9R4_HYPMA|nr:hypothetical protein Hypma_003180 [Hypsizygus marmoreus]
MHSIFSRRVAAFLLASLSAFVQAKPISLAERDLFVPPVLYPHDGTFWRVNQRHNVTWDISHPPVNITNKIGRIMLRKGRVTTPLILAKRFDILLGRIEVTVPWVIDGTDYQVVLIGDPGNFSQFFAITA